VNEYTRREEVRWILVSAVVLVSSVAIALGLLLSARGPVTPDPAAEQAAQTLDSAAKDLGSCADAASALDKEVAVFRDVAKASKVLEQQTDVPEQEEAPKTPPIRGRPPAPKPKPKPKPPDFTAQAWPAAKPTFERATRLVACRPQAGALLEPSTKADEAWRAVAAVSGLEAPKESDTPATHLTVARQIFAAVEKAPIEEIVVHVDAAKKAAGERAAEASAKAKTTTVQQPLPRGLLGREVAIAIGVLVSLVALLVSFFSLRATSVRRGGALAPFRKAAHPPERGIQAATILRLASEANGGEPGIVLGAGIGGMAAAALGRMDADWYVAGVTAGLVLGLLTQIVIKGIGATQNFRERALTLAEIEKPAVPIVLVLSTVRVGSEEDFLAFFLKLSPTEAANAVEKLATQAEEQILIAADAHAMK